MNHNKGVVMNNSTLKALKDSIKHHKENVKVLEGEGKFLKTSLQQFFEVGNYRIGYKKAYYDQKSCALCQISTSDFCKDCLLGLNGCGCNDKNSAWSKIEEAYTKPQALKAERNMVRVLEGLLPKRRRR